MGGSPATAFRQRWPRWVLRRRQGQPVSFYTLTGHCMKSVSEHAKHVTFHRATPPVSKTPAPHTLRHVACARNTPSGQSGLPAELVGGEIHTARKRKKEAGVDPNPSKGVFTYCKALHRTSSSPVPRPPAPDRARGLLACAAAAVGTTPECAILASGGGHVFDACMLCATALCAHPPNQHLRQEVYASY